MKSKRLRYVAIGGVIGLVAVAGVGVALPTIAARGLERKLEQVVAKREAIDASWREIEVSFGGELQMRDLHLEDHERGVVLDVERVYVRPTLKSLFNGEPDIKQVRVEGTILTVELDMVREALAQKKDEPDKPKPPKDPDSMSEKLKRRLKENPPEVIVERAQIKTRWKQAELVEVELEQAALSGGGGDPFMLAARGHFTTRYEKIPKLLRQRHAWSTAASYDPADKRVSVTLNSGSDAPLIELELPRIAMGRVGSLTVNSTLSELRAPRVEAHDLYLKAGGRAEDDLIASLEAETLAARVVEGQPQFEASGVSFELTPSKLDELSNLRDRFKPLGGALDRIKKQDAAQSAPMVREGGGASGEEAAARLHKLLEWGRKVGDVVGRADVQLDQGRFVVHLPREEQQEAFQALELISDLKLSLKEGDLQMQGTSSGGRFLASALFLPGQALPHSASLSATGVDLGKIPGMSQGRTLPNRGIRGKVGGIVDISAHLLTPITGIDLDAHNMMDEVTLRGAMQWHEGMLDINGVADAPLTELELGVQGALKWYPGRGEFRLEDGQVAYNGLTAEVVGELSGWPYSPVLQGEARMEETPCQEMVDALPDAMLGPYRRVTISGAAAPRFWVKWPLHAPHHLQMELDGLSEEDNPEFRRKWRRRSSEEEDEDEMSPARKHYFCKITKLHADHEAWPEVEYRDGPGSSGQARAKVPFPAGLPRTSRADVHWLNQPFVKRVTEGVSEEAEVYVGPGLESYVPLASLPTWVGGAMYLSEEILFFFNKGVSFGLIKKGLRINLEKGRFVYGGSTVTQQLVKNLFLTRDKTLSRKLQEALISLRIDEVVSKERLLELYLNCIEFGPDLYGIGPAAQFYFNKKARELTPMEAIFLAILKPSPSYGAHLKRRGELPGEGSWFMKRFDTIFERMVEYEVMTEEQVIEAKRQKLRWVNGIYTPEFLPDERSTDQVVDDLLRQMMGP